MFFFGLVIIHGDNWWILTHCKSSHFLHHFGHRNMLTDISANIFFKIDPRRGPLIDSIRFKLGKRQNKIFILFRSRAKNPWVSNTGSMRNLETMMEHFMLEAHCREGWFKFGRDSGM